MTLAKRLEQLGKEVAPEAGCVILASAATASRIGPSVRLVPLGARAVRDGREPVESWRLVTG